MTSNQLLNIDLFPNHVYQFNYNLIKGFYMANTPSAKKRVRISNFRTEVNKSRRSRIRTFIKQVEEDIIGGDSKKALDSFRKAQPEIHRGVNKGIFHKNTAARKLSRLSGKIKKLSLNT
tara:strand:+ start:440 stop:796 length:357 start_codon:yes stop_codon:yes gene_type:complete